jgi:hypothetical protein
MHRTDSSLKEQVLRKQFTVKSEAIGKLSAVNCRACYELFAVNLFCGEMSYFLHVVVPAMNCHCIVLL